MYSTNMINAIDQFRGTIKTWEVSEKNVRKTENGLENEKKSGQFE